MKRIVMTVTALLGGFALSAGSALALTPDGNTYNNPAPSTTTTTATTPASKATAAAATAALHAQHLVNLQTRGDAQIKLRLTTLNNLAKAITSAKHLTAADRTSLSSEVLTEITGLTALEGKLKADTTETAALADVQSIYTEFRVYALIDPKVHLVRAADNQQTIEATLSALATKLQDRITAAQKAGKDTTAMQTSLDDMKAQIAKAQVISTSMEAKIIVLQPSDYNSDHTILSGDAAQLKIAHADDHAAHKDAQTIINDLKALK